MTGVPTQLAISDLLAGSGFNIADSDKPYFDLGAIALAMTDFMPSRPDKSRNPSLFPVWQPILAILADAPGTPGLVSNVNHIRDVLTRARTIVEDAKSNFITSLEAKARLLDMLDEIEGLSDVVKALTTQLGTLSSLPTTIFSRIGNTKSRHKSLPRNPWRPRDLHHGSRTGAFLDVLRRRAGDSQDSRLIAFANGWAVAYGGALAGNAFLNGATGGPVRNQFWRHRWLSHRVDSWVWGYYATQRRLRRDGSDIVFTSQDRVPVPPLPTWDNVCGADLQTRFTFGGISAPAVLTAISTGTALPDFLPSDLVKLWIDSLREVHPSDDSTGIDAPTIQSAYALTWLVTWIQTSPEFLPAVPPDRINYPDSCGPRPSWAAPDGSVVVGGQQITPPPPAVGNPSVAKVASAVVAALLGLAAFLTGNVGAGVAAFAAAAALLDAGTPPNWDQMGCDLAWTDVYLVSLANAFRAMLTNSGLAPPYTVELAHNEVLFTLTSVPPLSTGDIVPPDAALASCRSPHRSEDGIYPKEEWQPASSNWIGYPTEPLEVPATTSFPLPQRWPHFFVDGQSITSDNGAPPIFTSQQVNPVERDSGSGRPVLLDRAEWDRRMERAELDGNPGSASFGNAVDITLLLLAADRGALQAWDLDGDRGIGWPTWLWPDDNASSGPVKRE